MGQEVRFVVEVTNTGDTVVPSPIPLKDTYNRAYLGFRSASPKPVSEKDDGRLDWTDITGGKGLAPGSSVSVELTFQASREGTSPGTRDVATVSGAVDEHGDPVPRTATTPTSTWARRR